MNALKQIFIKASFATAIVVVGLTELPANADSQSKECTYEPNNRVVCTQRGSSSTHSSSNSSSSRTTSNVNLDISQKDVENLFHGIINDRKRESSENNQNPRSNSTTGTSRNESWFGW